MPLSGNAVQSALGAVGALGKQLTSFDNLAAGAMDALRQAPPGLTPQGAACFLASCAMESAWFRTTQEYGSGQRYAPYIGRTLIQLTWEVNYRGFGGWCKGKGMVSDANCFVANPASLADVRWAWLGPVYYFEVNNIWKWANPGLFLAVSQAINGGVGRVGTAFVPNGMKARQAMFDAFMAQGDALLPNGPPAPSGPVLGPDSLPSLEYGMKNNPAVASLQRFCNLFDWRPALPILPVTGNYLDQTVAVLRSAQGQMGVQGGDGRNIGPQTKAALWKRGWRG